MDYICWYTKAIMKGLFMTMAFLGLIRVAASMVDRGQTTGWSFSILMFDTGSVDNHCKVVGSERAVSCIFCGGVLADH